MFVYTRKAQYHETDQMGVIHHANYVRWMEEARVEWMDSLGFGYKEMEARGIVSPVVSLNVRYLKPVSFSDTVEVRLRPEKYERGVRLSLSYEFYDRTTDTLCAQASSEHCFLKDGRPVSLRRALPEFDEQLSGILERTE